MKHGRTLALLVLLAGAAAAEDKVTESRIVGVSLFKNGLAVVKHRVVVPGPGTYLLADLPEPVHGTFWLTSNAKVATRSTTRLVEDPRVAATDLPRDLAGREVTVHFLDAKTAPLSGTVVAPDDTARPAAWNRDYAPPDNYYGYRSAYLGRPPAGAATGAAAPYLVLATADGHAFIQAGQVARLDVKGALAKAKRRVPVLLCTVETDQKPATIEVSYLAKGLAWLPSYRLDISDPKNLQLEQGAVIRNELADLQDVEIELISGYPNIEFAHVTSPLSMQTTLAAFFAQLDQRPRQGHASRSNLTQQVIAYNEPAAGPDLTARPAGEGVDLHYAAIGRRTLAEGDALTLPVATGKAAYDRIVEWLVPDNRRADGHYLEPHERQENPDAYGDEAWDALRFKNPLPYPMTTAPAMIVDRGRFNGQCLSYWVNSGETAVLHVTKALSVRTRCAEIEEPNGRADVNVGGDRYWRVPVKGELVANNHRNEAITLLIRRRFSGDLVSADQAPKSRLLEEGVYQVNPRRELTWELKLKPGEEIKLAYAYTVLVRH